MEREPQTADPDTAGEQLLDEPDFVVLNAIFLKKMATTADIAGLLGLEEKDLLTLLERAALAGLIMTTDSGHILLPEGTEGIHRHYDKTYAALRENPMVGPWYERFEVINSRFIEALTNWQQMKGEDLLFKALDIVERLCAELTELAVLVPRYAGYQRRFETALQAIEAGDLDLLCNPRRDSAHNIWFEFHEDILCVLGRPRDTT